MTEPQKAFNLIHCPICHRKTRTRVLLETVLVDFPLFCPKCKQTCIVDIKDNQITILHDRSEIPANLL